MSTTSLSASDILIRAQDTPNPSAIKFITNVPLKSVGNATFSNKSEAENLPLVSSLFDIPGVEQIYLFQNTLTLTHIDELPSDIVKENAVAVIRSRILVHDADFESPEEIKIKHKPEDGRAHV